MIVVWNLHRGEPLSLRAVVVRIDQKALLSNPFVMREESMRDEACDFYEQYFATQMSEKGAFYAAVQSLLRTSKDPAVAALYLCCWCAPKRCHGDTIKAYLEAQGDGFVVCFTGHRPPRLGGYDWNSPVNRRIMAALRSIVKSYLAKYPKVHFIFGGALGLDQMAFDVCSQLWRQGVTLEVALPFAGFGAFWPSDSKALLQQQCSRADVVTTVDTVPGYVVVPESGYHIAKLQARNQYMVDRADAVVAVYDGGTGGTAHCVNYARRLGKTLVLVDPATCRVRKINGGDCSD